MTHVRGRVTGRRRARAAALQMLYEAEIGGLGIEDVLETYWAEQGPALSEPLRRFANELVRGVLPRAETIDRLIGETAEHWRFERIALVDRLILRLAVYELLDCPDRSPNVVINEALELARTFSTEDAVRFINGNLDAIKRRLAEPPTGCSASPDR